ncbi:hypothetical protein TrVE_jg5576 [Triparma verrucosa]|uniref:Thioredoxin domain-containing protein n=1 Tax=Triparma verrucosa TaxID=1606542 RepID=A0A9W7B7K9_9STRA|nr:hypothetical protein TrVE_jg5576 [Triparma verrucosa]
MFRPRLLARSSYTLLRPRSPSRPFERSRRAFSSPPSSSRNGIIFISGLLGLSYFAYNTLGNTIGNNTLGNDDAESISNSFFKKRGVKDVQSVTKPLKRPPALIALLPSATFLKRFTLSTPHPDSQTLTLLYFSSPWCPPCKRFTPVLKSFYGKVNLKKFNVEVLLIPCSSTTSISSSLKEGVSYYDDYSMDWLRFDETDIYTEDNMNFLKERFNVWAGPLDNETFKGKDHRGIPTLVLVGRGGEVVYDMAREDVERAVGEGREMELVEGWREACEKK